MTSTSSTEAHVDFPACLRLAGKRVLVVGGGEIATRRCADLVAAGARVLVVAPDFSQGIFALALRGRLAILQREVRTGDVRGHDVVFVATTDEEVSRVVAREARALGTWINAADQPELCDFTLPSVGRRGPITVAVSTGGAAPALAAWLRRRLTAAVEERDVALAEDSAQVRQRVPPGPDRMQLLRDMAGRRAGEAR